MQHRKQVAAKKVALSRSYWQSLKVLGLGVGDLGLNPANGLLYAGEVLSMSNVTLKVGRSEEYTTSRHLQFPGARTDAAVMNQRVGRYLTAGKT